MTRFFANEDGIALATVIGMIVVLTVLSVVLIDQVTTESDRSASAATSDAVFQAAEAGINDYLAKLTEDPAYYDHCVAKGESTRERDDNHALVSHSVTTNDCEPGGVSAWPSSVKWTYPNNQDWWYSGTSDTTSQTAMRGYAYNLMITPPYAAVGTNPGTDYIDIVSTGCKVKDPAASPLVCDPRYHQRAIEVRAQITTPAAFQYMMNDMDTSGNDVCWASTVYGDMYSTGDIYVCGATFYGNVLAEGNVVVKSGYANPPNVISPGKIYTNSTTPPLHPTILKNALNISDIVGSISQVQTNAELNTNLRAGSSSTGVGTDFDDTSASAWRINFKSDGTVQVWKCLHSSSPEYIQPYCSDVHLSGGSVTLKSSTPGTTVNVDEAVDSFPTASSTNPQTIYIAPTTLSAPTTAITYTGEGETTNAATGITTGWFTGVRCSSCGTGGVTFPAGVALSLYNGGTAPAYNGPVPSNGAIYTGQDAIISWPTNINGYTAIDAAVFPASQLNGRVTVASASDILIAGDVHYASESVPNGTSAPNNDVLGLIAQKNITVAQYAPDKLWWRAATVAVGGSWGDYACQNGPVRDGSTQGSSSFTFVGTATYGSNTGCMRSTGTHAGGYGYIDGTGALRNVYRITDNGTAPSCPTTAPNCTSFTALKYLNPPWFPPLNGIETVLFREVRPGYIPPAAPSGS
jgi:Tfp pilus assembly protein PilX